MSQFTEVRMVSLIQQPQSAFLDPPDVHTCFSSASDDYILPCMFPTANCLHLIFSLRHVYSPLHLSFMFTQTGCEQFASHTGTFFAVSNSRSVPSEQRNTWFSDQQSVARPDEFLPLRFVEGMRERGEGLFWRAASEITCATINRTRVLCAITPGQENAGNRLRARPQNNYYYYHTLPKQCPSTAVKFSRPSTSI